jgi:hypothetical protein
VYCIFCLTYKFFGDAEKLHKGGVFMGMIHWTKEKIHDLTILDFAAIRVALVLFGLLMVAFILVFVKQYELWFIGGFLVLYTLLVYRVFKKK